MVDEHAWSMDSEEAKVYLQNLLENISDSIYFKDRKSRFLLVNDACLKKHGFQKLEDTLGKTDADVFTEAHAKEAREDEKRIIATGDPIVGIEEKETWPDGSVTYVSTTKMPLRDSKGKIIGTFGISRDITGKKMADLLAAEYAAEIKQLKEAMEDDVRLAGELQKAFFPKSYPAFDGKGPEGRLRVEFAHRINSIGLVGGDLCSIKKISEDEAGIFLCDVMGHGVRAALGTAIIRSLIEELSPIETDPGKFLAHMNERVQPIFQQSQDVMFITAVYCIINTRTGEMRFSSAGHPLPIHHSIRREKTLRSAKSPENTALALFEDSKYETIHQKIEAGDTVLLFTDGIYEVVNDKNEQFGKTRLARMVNEHAHDDPGSLVDSIMKDCQDFSESGKFDDDTCLVAIRWNGLEENG